MTQCPVYFGRMNKIGNAVEMMKWQREHAVSKKEASTMSPEEMAGKFIIGELYNNPSPEYCEEYEKIIARAQGRE